jgi:hypothetical protein
MFDTLNSLKATGSFSHFPDVITIITFHTFAHFLDVTTIITHENYSCKVVASDCCSCNSLEPYQFGGAKNGAVLQYGFCSGSGSGLYICKKQQVLTQNKIAVTENPNLTYKSSRKFFFLHIM